jgi:enamine deaminase RidA (YjgF/YER057c/UK114 family)
MRVLFFAMRHTLASLVGLILVAGLMTQSPPALAQPQPKMAKKKKNEDKEPVTQTLALPADPPPAVVAETGRLTFAVSPLSGKGLLSQQTRDALKALMQPNRGQIVRLRAFVAGTGDMRRVQAIVSEVFTDKKTPLPVLTTIQVSALPMEDAQVELEATFLDRKVVNPDGVAFLVGERAPSISNALEQLKRISENAGVGTSAMLGVTCYLSSLEGVEGVRASVASAFPQAPVSLVESQRSPREPFSSCEGVGRVVAGRSPSSVARAAVVKTPKIVFSGLQMAFGKQDTDLKLAFDRLNRALKSANPSAKVVAIHFYASEPEILPKLTGLGKELFRLDSLTSAPLEVEGLPSLDASFGMDAIAEAAN